MMIAVDAGNSHIRFGGYEADGIQFHAAIQTAAGQTSDFYAATCGQLFSLYKVPITAITGAVIASVVPNITSILSDALSFLGVPKILTVSSGIKTGLNIKTDSPRQIGADRIAAAVGARACVTMPCIVIDCGTATTFTVLDANGTLVGSVISAGVGTSLSALRGLAAQLPMVSLSGDVTQVLAKNTEDAMRVGIVRGAAAMVEGLARELSSQLTGTSHILLTGGAAELILPHLQIACTHMPTLCLDGLYEIWKKNERS